METSTISDGVTDDKPFSCPHILIPHGCKLCLQGNRIINGLMTPRAAHTLATISDRRRDMYQLPAILSQRA